jgi:Na+/H+ antiporter NhaC
MVELNSFWSLVPSLVVIILALGWRRSVEPLVLGIVVGAMLLGGGGFFAIAQTALITQLSDETLVWIVLVCGLFGALIFLLTDAGGAVAFARWVEARVASRVGLLMSTWLMGLVIFIDDYLNALTVGNAMRPVADRLGVSRSMLAYIVDATAAPVCVLIPLSTWAVFVVGTLETVTLPLNSSGMTLYLSAIPFMLYPIVTVIMVPLVAVGLIPNLGPMQRAATGDEARIRVEDARGDVSKAHLIDFALPLTALIMATMWFDADALSGVLVALSLTAAFYVARGLTKAGRIIPRMMAGFASMLEALFIVVLSFVLKDVNDQLGLTAFVLSAVDPLLVQLDGLYPGLGVALLPATIFLLLSVITFATGSFWGTMAITIPVVLPLCQAVGLPLTLGLGTVVSAGAFGSHACFYGDTTVLAAKASGITAVEHALTQLPYVVLAASVSTIGFVLMGWWMVVS